MTSQTKCIEVLAQTYNKQTGVYSVSYFDNNIEDSEIQETTISQDSLFEFIEEHDLNLEEFVNSSLINLECDGLDQRYINVFHYLDENTDSVITEYLNTNS